jgi:hypothetical protein
MPATAGVHCFIFVTFDLIKEEKLGVRRKEVRKDFQGIMMR